MLASVAAAVAQTPAPPPVDAAVIEAVYGFYSSYLDYTRTGPSGERTGHYVVDRAYRTSPFLSSRLIAEVDSLLANADPSEGWGDDPFLRARGIPVRIGLELVAAARHNATALVHLYFGNNPLPHTLALRLTDEGGLWRIDDIRRDDVTPAGSVQTFYDSYLQQVRITSPVRAAALGCTGASYAPAAFSRRQDPFLLDDGLPVAVDVTLLQQTAGEAEVLVMRTFAGDVAALPLYLTLRLGGECTQISGVSDLVPPQMVAQAFYNRYLQAARIVYAFQDVAFDAVDFADYLGPRLLGKVPPVLTVRPLHPTDPFFRSERLPEAVTAELVTQIDNQATVQMLGSYHDGPGRMLTQPMVTLKMLFYDGRWWIEDFTEP